MSAIYTENFTRSFIESFCHDALCGDSRLHEALWMLDGGQRGGIDAALEERGFPELRAALRDSLLTFADIVRVPDGDIQKILGEVYQQDLAVALKTADAEIRNTVLSTLSDRAAAMLREDMEYMGPVPAEREETCLEGIASVMRRLADSGEIHIPGYGRG